MCASPGFFGVLRALRIVEAFLVQPRNPAKGENMATSKRSKKVRRKSTTKAGGKRRARAAKPRKPRSGPAKKSRLDRKTVARPAAPKMGARKKIRAKIRAVPPLAAISEKTTADAPTLEMAPIDAILADLPTPVALSVEEVLSASVPEAAGIPAANGAGPVTSSE
jgi:hypothetical protein